MSVTAVRNFLEGSEEKSVLGLNVRVVERASRENLVIE